MPSPIGSTCRLFPGGSKGVCVADSAAAEAGGTVLSVAVGVGVARVESTGVNVTGVDVGLSEGVEEGFGVA